jgi:GrpB-like predicted nucleotidyltransferase (UPF0157 family)
MMWGRQSCLQLQPAWTAKMQITLAAYDPNWPQLFAHEAAQIRAALGPAVLQLEHTGSTAVPGLAAKPVIDILLVVADSSRESTYAPALKAAGYTLRIREPEWYEHRMFNGPRTAVNLHVFSSGCPEMSRIRMFRDWLRNHPADRDLYARTKQSLAELPWNEVQNYADAKTAVIEEILTRAAQLRTDA